MSKEEQNYWNQRYLDGSTGWDIGYPSTPLKTYIDQLEDKSLRILIPGAGNAYEAEYLWKAGFSNTTVIDIAPEATQAFAKRNTDFPQDQLLTADFFSHQGEYDLILEQTFHCAIMPEMRDAYVKHLSTLLPVGGRYVGVLFDIPLGDTRPFGGTKEEYQERFERWFDIQVLERCYNSIPPRQGNELFIHATKRD